MQVGSNRENFEKTLENFNGISSKIYTNFGNRRNFVSLYKIFGKPWVKFGQIGW